jgi:hypothetical protein
MKKIFMVAVLATAMFAAFNANGQSVGDVFNDGTLIYKITSLSPNEVQVGTGSGSGTGLVSGVNYSGSITIPSQVVENGQTFSVTAVGGGGSGAFDGCSRLTSVTIPESVTSIGGVLFLVAAA